MARDLRRHWARLIGGALLVLAAAQLAPRVVRPPELEENRVAAPAPAWPPRDLDVLRGEADAWVADHFPPRRHLIGGLNWLRLQAGASGSPRVVVGRDGWLFFDNGTHLGAARNDPPMSDAAASAWLAGLAGRTEALRARGIAYVVLVAPDKEAVFPQHGPAWYRGPDPNRPAALLPRLATAAQAGRVVYPHAELVRQSRWGLKTYVPYETHWTGLGAYQGYAALMRTLRAQGAAEGPLPLESFVDVTQSPSVRPRNLALMLGVASFVDTTFPELEDPLIRRTMRVTPLTADADWTAPHVIDTGEVGKPVLLMTRDSFSTALLPFVYRHFSRVVLSHNQDGAWREDLIARFRPDVVVLQTVESGLPVVMSAGPPPSREALARVRAAVAWRGDHEVRPAPPGIRRQGGEGADRLVGGEGPDDLAGLPGDDVLIGDGGADRLHAGRGRDRVDGGPGDDWLSGGRDDDQLTGGPGADVFHVVPYFGTDVVLDFDPGEGDRVEVGGGAEYRVAQAGPDTVVELPGARLVLKNTVAAGLPRGAVGR